jgi:type II secretory pathway component PulF
VKDLTALDWIGVVVVGIGILWIAVLIPFVYVPTFAAMYADFGGMLPAGTRILFARWPSVILGLIPVGIVVASLTGTRTVQNRRALIVAAFVVALLILGASVTALYLPVFQLAGNIQP